MELAYAAIVRLERTVHRWHYLLLRVLRCVRPVHLVMSLVKHSRRVVGIAVQATCVVLARRIQLRQHAIQDSMLLVDHLFAHHVLWVVMAQHRLFLTPTVVVLAVVGGLETQLGCRL